MSVQDRIEALRVRGALLTLQGDYTGARTCLGTADALAERIGDEDQARRVRINARARATSTATRSPPARSSTGCPTRCPGRGSAWARGSRSPSPAPSSSRTATSTPRSPYTPARWRRSRSAATTS